MYWSHFDAPTSVGLVQRAGFEVLEALEVEDAGETPLWLVARGAD